MSNAHQGYCSSRAQYILCHLRETSFEASSSWSWSTNDSMYAGSHFIYKFPSILRPNARSSLSDHSAARHRCIPTWLSVERNALNRYISPPRHLLPTSHTLAAQTYKSFLAATVALTTSSASAGFSGIILIKKPKDGIVRTKATQSM